MYIYIWESAWESSLIHFTKSDSIFNFHFDCKKSDSILNFPFDCKKFDCILNSPFHYTKSDCIFNFPFWQHDFLFLRRNANEQNGFIWMMKQQIHQWNIAFRLVFQCSFFFSSSNCYWLNWTNEDRTASRKAVNVLTLGSAESVSNICIYIYINKHILYVYNVKY